MLAHKYEDYKDEISYPLYAQPKLDGIRCIAKKDGLWSRNGKAILSVPHIHEALSPLFNQYPDLILDGELYCDKLANDFNKICSLVKKTKPTREDLVESRETIEYHIYDIPSNEGTFVERFYDKRTFDIPEYCKWVHTYMVDSEEEIINGYEWCMRNEYEGQMLRKNEKYENKRSKNLLKHKMFEDDEFEILYIEEGKGNRAGKAGKAYFNSKNGQEFSADFSFDWVTMAEIWKNRRDYIGKKATVKYFRLTPGGVPRFGKVIKIDRDSYE
jgi:DNA ligase-1